MGAEVFVARLNLQRAETFYDEIDAVERFLVRKKIDPTSLLYRGFNGAQMRIVLEYGTDVLKPTQKFIEAVNYEHFKWKYEYIEPEVHPIQYTEEWDIPALSIYSAATAWRGEHYRYYFRNGAKNALVGIIRLEY